MPSAIEAPMPKPSSVFCGCCRSPKKLKQAEKHQRALQDGTQEPIRRTLTATTSLPPQAIVASTVTPIPQIVVTSPPNFHASPKKSAAISGGGGKTTSRDVFETARSSTDTFQYQSMAELVRGIRREAGVPDTPRVAVIDEDPTRHHAVQLNVEHLIDPPPSSSAPLEQAATSTTVITVEELDSVASSPQPTSLCAVGHLRDAAADCLLRRIRLFVVHFEHVPLLA